MKPPVPQRVPTFASRLLRAGLLEGVSVLVGGAPPVPQRVGARAAAREPVAQAVRSACAELGASLGEWDPALAPGRPDVVIFDGAGAFACAPEGAACAREGARAPQGAGAGGDTARGPGAGGAGHSAGPADRARATGRADGRLVFRWSETGGPPVKPPTRRGFGTSVVAGMIRDQLGGVFRHARLLRGGLGGEGWKRRATHGFVPRSAVQGGRSAGVSFRIPPPRIAHNLYAGSPPRRAAGQPTERCARSGTIPHGVRSRRKRSSTRRGPLSIASGRPSGGRHGASQRSCMPTSRPSWLGSNGSFLSTRARFGPLCSLRSSAEN